MIAGGILLLAAPADAIVSPPVDVPIILSGSTTPQLVQHVSSASMSPFVGDPNGNNYTFKLPNPPISGDALIVKLTYTNGLAVSSISHTVGGSFGAACQTTGQGNAIVSAVYVLPNVSNPSSAIDTFTITLNSAANQFSYTVSEWTNIATSSPCNGGKATNSISPSGGSISPGAFTPGANPAGNLILTFVDMDEFGNNGTSPTGWTAGTNFTLLDDMTANTGSGYLSRASQYYFQATPASLTPSITVAGSTDQYNSISVALKVAPSGGPLPSTIYIVKINHESSVGTPNSGTWHLQQPTAGNLRVYVLPWSNLVTSITSSDTCAGGVNTYTPEIADPGNSPQIWFEANCPANPNLVNTFVLSTGPQYSSERFFDVANAAASPFDVAAGGATGSCPGTTKANAPNITPTGTGRLVIAGGALSTGPGLAVTSPTGAIWDLVNYPGETDACIMENADLLGHFYNGNTTLENWTWTITNTGQGCGWQAAAFH